MQRKQILALPSMPAAGPSDPRGPYRLVDREFMVIPYESDPAVIREQLPEPLTRLDRPLVSFEWVRMPDCTGFGSYTESGMVIPCLFEDQEVNFVSQMYLDDVSYPTSTRPSPAGRRRQRGRAPRGAPMRCGRVRRPWLTPGREGLAMDLLLPSNIPGRAPGLLPRAALRALSRWFGRVFIPAPARGLCSRSALRALWRAASDRCRAVCRRILCRTLARAGALSADWLYTAGAIHLEWEISPRERPLGGRR